MRLVFLASSSIFALTAGFVLTERKIHQGSSATSTSLEAKKKKKKTKERPVIGGGFGSVAKKEDKQDNDYAVFPRLEPQVLETLDPAPEDWATEAGPLPQEVVDRLDQIYGFGRFNFDNTLSLESLMTLQQPEDEEDPLSIANLPPFENFRILHVDPLLLAVDDFFTPQECEKYIRISSKEGTRSPTVGKDTSAKAQRTSTTYYHHFHEVPELVAKASRLMGLQETITHWEEPQTVRYRPNEKFTWHLDALGPQEESNSGQRIATLLVYLNDCNDSGGATKFRDLNVAVQPRQGSALLFFPAAGGLPNTPFDVRTLHCGQPPVEDDKWIAQLWLRPNEYTPTAPPGNTHSQAAEAIQEFCNSN